MPRQRRLLCLVTNVLRLIPNIAQKSSAPMTWYAACPGFQNVYVWCDEVNPGDTHTGLYTAEHEQKQDQQLNVKTFPEPARPPVTEPFTQFLCHFHKTKTNKKTKPFNKRCLVIGVGIRCIHNKVN